MPSVPFGQPAPRSPAFPVAPLSQPNDAGWRKAVHPGEEANQVHPIMPSAKALEEPAALNLNPATPSVAPAEATPALSAMPPVKLGPSDLAPTAKAPMAAATPPVQPGAMPSVAVGPQQQRYDDISKQPAPELHGWKRVLDTIGSIFPIGRAIEQGIPGSPQNYDARLTNAAMRAAREQTIGKGQREAETETAKAQFETPEKRRAYLAQHPDEFEGASDFQKNDFILAGKFPQKEPADTTGKTPEETTIHDLMTGENGQPRVNPETKQPYTYLDAYKAVNQAKADTKPTREPNAEEGLRQQISTEMAKPKPDQKLLKNLRDRLEAMNPLGEDRLRASEDRAAEANKKKDATERALDVAAESLAKGDLTSLKDISSLRGDQRLLLYSKIKALSPKFDTSSLDRKIKMMEQYTGGKQGDQLQSLGTFLEHAGALKDTMGSLQGVMPAKILNHSINWLRKNVSDDPAYPRVLAALDPVQKEFESYLLNNRALYSEDREAVTQVINGDMPIKQMEGSVQQMGHTVQARYNEAGKRFKNTMGKSFEEMGLALSDEALDGAKKIGVTIGGGSGTKAGSDNPLGLTPPGQH